MDKHQLNVNPKVKKTLRKFGPIILGTGILFFIIAVVDLMTVQFGPPTLFFLGFIGMPLMFVGAVMTSYGYMGTVARYTASEMAPVAKDVTNYMLDGTRDAVSQTIGQVVREVKGERTSAPIVKPCPFCKELPNPGAKFCDNCGRQLEKECPKCQTKNDGDASFCQSCGNRL